MCGRVSLPTAISFPWERSKGTTSPIFGPAPYGARSRDFRPRSQDLLALP